MVFKKGNTHRFLTGNTFGTLTKGMKKRSSPHPPDCAHCVAVRTGQKFDVKAWNKKYQFVRNIRKYGLTPAEYDARLAEQNGKCAICGRPPYGKSKRLAIDHDHETGVVRGFLCLRCNTSMGFVEKQWHDIMKYLGQCRE